MERLTKRLPIGMLYGLTIFAPTGNGKKVLTMAEYIERTEELILAVNAGARAIENTKRYHGASYCFNVFSDNHKEIPYLKAAEVLRGFEEIPAADVAPVRHGRWLHRKNGIAYCSECEIDTVEDDTNYCPNCGAKMDGERKDEGADNKS